MKILLKYYTYKNDMLILAPTGIGKSCIIYIPLIYSAIQQQPQYLTSMLLVPTKSLAYDYQKIVESNDNMNKYIHIIALTNKNMTIRTNPYKSNLIIILPGMLRHYYQLFINIDSINYIQIDNFYYDECHTFMWEDFMAGLDSIKLQQITNAPNIRNIYITATITKANKLKLYDFVYFDKPDIIEINFGKLNPNIHYKIKKFIEIIHLHTLMLYMNT